jgi:hypothetical protein
VLFLSDGLIAQDHGKLTPGEVLDVMKALE